jgi:hypothetical protein
MIILFWAWIIIFVIFVPVWILLVFADLEKKLKPEEK